MSYSSAPAKYYHSDFLLKRANIRHRLKVSDENIMALYPDVEQFLEEGITIESLLDNITNQYLNAPELPQSELINVDTSSPVDWKKDEEWNQNGFSRFTFSLSGKYAVRLLPIGSFQFSDTAFFYH